jgi:alpha-galactosidase
VVTVWLGISAPPSAVAARGGVVGASYLEAFANTREVLGNLGAEFPEWAGQGYQIAGFGWHQGWADGGNTAWANEYQQNLANLIDDLRVEFGSPNLPISIADSGFFGVGGQTGNLLTVKNAQDAIGSLVSPHPVFAGTVLTGDTAPFWRDPADSPNSTNQPHHWNYNGESYFLIGKALGDDMVDLLTP